jgi:hypothetical protein
MIANEIDGSSFESIRNPDFDPLENVFIFSVDRTAATN